MNPAVLKRAELALADARDAIDVEKRAVGLFGSLAGKSRIADELIRLFPTHKAYTEVFAGEAAVFWTKNKVDTEVLNDTHTEIAHAFKFVRDITDAQIKTLEKKNWIASRKLFDKFRSLAKAGEFASDPLERLYRFLYLKKAGYACQETSYSPINEGNHVAKTLFRRLPKFRDRLAGVEVFNDEYAVPLKQFDSEDTLHFLDPPYPSFPFGIGETKFNEDEFFKNLSELKGKFVLTYETRNELNRELKKDYTVRVWRQQSNSGYAQGDDATRKTQTIVTNFEKKKDASVQVPGFLERTMRTLELPSRQCEALMADATKFVSSKKSLANKSWCVSDGKREYGIVTFSAPTLIDLWKFTDLIGEHRLSESDRKDLFGEAEKLWAYPVKSFRQLDDGSVKIELNDEELAAIKSAALLSAEFAAAVPGFVERRTKFADDADRNFLKELPDIADAMSQVLSKFRDGEPSSTRGAIPVARDLLAAVEVFSPKIADLGGFVAVENGAWALSGVLKLAEDAGSEPSVVDPSREIPKEIIERIKVVTPPGGSLGDVDLWIVPRTHSVAEALAEAGISKAGEIADGTFDSCGSVRKGETTDLPAVRGKQKASVQLHFVGKRLHTDLRLALNDQALCWTVANQIEDRSPRVDTLGEGRRIARRFDRDGNFFLKSWTNGSRAFPRGMTNKAWLDVEAERFEAGEIGASAGEAGVIVKSDEGLEAEYGLQAGAFSEYMLTGDPRFMGRLMFTKIADDFWRSFWPESLLPSVLSKRAVDDRLMPAAGYSAIPITLENVVPEEFQYWKMEGVEAIKARDALVSSGLFNADNIRIVNGEFQRVITKVYLDVGKAQEQAKKSMPRYGLAWQFWKSEGATKPSREHWHLVVQNDDGFDVWRMPMDPSRTDSASAVHRTAKSDALLSYDGKVDPGQIVGGEALNTTKETPSWIKNIERGHVEILSRTDDEVRLRMPGVMKGECVLRREEPGSRNWSVEITRKGGAAPDGRGRSANVFVEEAVGIAYVTCPSCSSLNLRSTGVAKDAHHIIECNDCSSQFGVPGVITDRSSFISRAEKEASDRGIDVDINVAVAETMLDDSWSDDVSRYLNIKTVKVDNGIQVWSGGTDPGADRSQLRPLASYPNMQPGVSFENKDELVEKFATPTVLGVGVIIEPMLKGRLLSVQKRGSRVVVFEKGVDVTKDLSQLADTARRVRGDMVVEGILVDDRFMVTDALYLPTSRNIASKKQSERRRKLEWVEGFDHDLVPAKIVRTKDELRQALNWAASQANSSGAMVKSVDATYQLTGSNDLWAAYAGKADEPTSDDRLIEFAIKNEMRVFKQQEERFVLGIVLEPNDGGKFEAVTGEGATAPLDPDSQKDVYSAEEVRQAAHAFLEKFANTGVMHTELANDRVKILESYVAPADFKMDGGENIKKGTWMMAVRVLDDNLWKAVQQGQLTGFSIGGSARKMPFSEEA